MSMLPSRGGDERLMNSISVGNFAAAWRRTGVCEHKVSSVFQNFGSVDTHCLEQALHEWGHLQSQTAHGLLGRCMRS